MSQFFALGVETAQVRYALSKLSRGMQNKLLRKPLRAAAKVIYHEMKRQVPKGETGQLRKSIKVRAARRSRTGPGVVVSISRKLGEDGFYAPFIEFGTQHRKRADGTRKEGYRIRPRHWQERSFNRKKNEAVRAFLSGMKRELAGHLSSQKKFAGRGPT